MQDYWCMVWESLSRKGHIWWHNWMQTGENGGHWFCFEKLSWNILVSLDQLIPNPHECHTQAFVSIVEYLLVLIVGWPSVVDAHHPWMRYECWAVIIPLCYRVLHPILKRQAKWAGHLNALIGLRMTRLWRCIGGYTRCLTEFRNHFFSWSSLYLFIPYITKLF